MEIKPKILKREVELAVDRLKKGKAAGPDMVDILVPHLTNLFNEVIENNWVPEQWYTAEIILLYKKGSRENIENYRLVSLTSNISKIFTTVVKNRIYNQLDMNQGREQAGFKKNFSTLDNIFALNQIMEKTIEYNMKIKLMFIDFKKAFNCVDHEYLWGTLQKQGISEYWIRVIRKIYNNQHASIH